MHPTYPSSKYKVVTAGTSPFTYTDLHEPMSRAIYVSGAGDVTVTADDGTSVVIPFAANMILPIMTRYVTAYTGSGSVVVLF